MPDRPFSSRLTAQFGIPNVIVIVKLLPIPVLNWERQVKIFLFKMSLLPYKVLNEKLKIIDFE